MTEIHTHQQTLNNQRSILHNNNENKLNIPKTQSIAYIQNQNNNYKPSTQSLNYKSQQINEESLENDHRHNQKDKQNRLAFRQALVKRLKKKLRNIYNTN